MKKKAVQSDMAGEAEELRQRIRAEEEKILQSEKTISESEARLADERFNAALQEALIQAGCQQPKFVARAVHDRFRLDDKGNLEPSDRKEIDTATALDKIRNEFPELFGNGRLPAGGAGREEEDRYTTWARELSDIRA